MIDLHYVNHSLAEYIFQLNVIGFNYYQNNLARQNNHHQMNDFLKNHLLYLLFLSPCLISHNCLSFLNQGKTIPQAQRR